MKKKRLKKKPIIILIIGIIAVIVGIKYIKPEKNIEKNKKVKDVKDVKVIKEKKDKTMSMVMVGDVLIHESVYKDAYQNGEYNFDSMFSFIKPMIKDYDLKYCNQESIIGGKNLKISGYPAFNSPDEIGDTIVDLGFNVIGLANNHAYDKGEEAILYSNQYWSNKGVIKEGTYSSFDERDSIQVYEQNGIKYGFLAYTTGINGNKLPQGKEYLINIYDEDKVKEDIGKIKDKVDLVMVAMHWGDEYTNTPTNSEREIASYLSSLGVDMIIGTHPHVIQPIEYINDTLVIYSLGNFISNQLVLGVNPAIGLLLGVDIKITDDGPKFDIRQKELIYSYSDNSTKFKVIPFSKMNNDILKDYKTVEQEYLAIIDNKKS